jgi:CRISPR/Cas system CSM-associated protein Csm2 small subunit
MTLTIEKNISDEEKIQFINEIVIKYKFTKINTSKTIQPDVVNVECVTYERLKSILDQIDKTSLTVTIDHDDDTIILVH